MDPKTDKWPSQDTRFRRPESIAAVSFSFFRCKKCFYAIPVESYFYVVNQERSARTWELDRKYNSLHCISYIFQSALPMTNGNQRNHIQHPRCISSRHVFPSRLAATTCLFVLHHLVELRRFRRSHLNLVNMISQFCPSPTKPLPARVLSYSV